MKISSLLSLFIILGAMPIYGQSTPAPAAATTSMPTASAATAALGPLKPFLFEGTHFSILTPVPLVANSKTDPNAGGKVVLTTWIGKIDGSEYGVNLVVVPGSVADLAVAQTMLDNLSASMAASVHGKVTSTKNVTVDGYPGRDSVLTGTNASGEALLTSRIIFMGDRIFQIGVAQPVAHPDPTAANAFIQSFKLVGIPPASAVAAKPASIETKSVAGQFSVMTPVALQESNQSGMHVFKGGSLLINYMVGYVDNAIAAGQDAKASLQQRAQAMADNLHGKIISQKTLTLDGNPGIEIMIAAEMNNKSFSNKVHLFTVGQRLYLLQFLAIQTKLDEAVADEFLNSFKLLPVASAPAH